MWITPFELILDDAVSLSQKLNATATDRFWLTPALAEDDTLVPEEAR
jgi:hypothetical protein